MQKIRCGFCKKTKNYDEVAIITFDTPGTLDNYLCGKCYIQYMNDINAAISDVKERWSYELKQIAQGKTGLPLEEIFKFAAEHPEQVTTLEGGDQIVNMPNGYYRLWKNLKHIDH